VSRSGSAEKSFAIPKSLVWEAYKRVAANKGAAGVDRQSLAEFDKDLKNNLYKIWNRMSSGTYSRQRCARWRYPSSTAAVPGSSGCQPHAIG
jgi:retron-type reverse transcriptase